MRRAEARVAVAAAIAAAAWLACARPAELAYEERLEAAPAPERHAIQSARLAEHMRRLERTRTERLPQALDLDTREARMRDVVAEVAAQLAVSAERISDALGDLELDAAERTAFDRLAGELAREARTLAAEAPALSSDHLQAQLGRIDDACARCHARFRIPLDADAGMAP